MALITPTESSITHYSVTATHWALHNGTRVIRVGNGCVSSTTYQIIASDTKAEVDAEIDRLGLTSEAAASPIIGKGEFLALITPTELDWVRSSTDLGVKKFWEVFNAASYVDRSWQPTIDGLNYIESLGGLAEGRAAQLLAY